ncbi:MAG: heavy metal translocating P-type ATPase metal-binding domain-containing protein [Methylohalobius sp.]|nr:heavy metal translocating P-type ATPase metal-binding domain-containing protein [Methylohalobius sp.]
MNSKPYCDLCALPVEIPDFTLKTKSGIKRFCCEGCLGIYRLLHEDELAEEKETIDDPSPQSDSDL